MLNGATAFSGFSTNDIPKAKAFYADTLGLNVTEEIGALNLKFPNGQTVFIYPKGDNHQPATYTTLNFEVDDIEGAVDDLVANGVTFERYPEMTGQDERGIMRDEGPADRLVQGSGRQHPVADQDELRSSTSRRSSRAGDVARGAALKRLDPLQPGLRAESFEDQARIGDERIRVGGAPLFAQPRRVLVQR